VQRKTFFATIDPVGERQVRVRCSTGMVDRGGDIVVQAGGDLSGYQSNPVMLWQHNPDVPVARAMECAIVNGAIEALAQFPPVGISAKADEICGLAKSQIINAVSIGFDVHDAEPIDPKKPRGAMRFLKWELLEISFVSVPANRDALVIARQHKEKAATPMKVKGLYAVGELAWLMAQLGWATTDAEIEAQLEGDASKVPAMLGDALRQLGETLIAMTQEEVAELIADHTTPDVEGVVLDDPDDVFVTAGKTPAIQCFRRGLVIHKARAAAVEKSGKKFSAATLTAMQASQDMHAEAGKMHKKAASMHTKACAAMKSVMDDAEPDDTDDAQADDPPATDDATDAQKSAQARSRRLKAMRLLAVSPA
jgi:HK97 family phage prohead protease